jgi:hypothetical protein
MAITPVNENCWLVFSRRRCPERKDPDHHYPPAGEVLVALEQKLFEG